MMAGARPVFADIDPQRADASTRRGSPTAIGAAHARDPAGASLRPAGRHGGDRARRRAPPPRRSSRTAARRTSRPPAAVRSAPSASPARSASTRPRTSARSATAAPSSPTIAALAERDPAAAQRRPERSLSSRGTRHQLAARRDAGGDPARAAAAAARLDERAPRARRRAIGRGSPARAVDAAARARSPATSTICSSSRTARARRAAGASRGQRHRNADPLPGADSAPAGARRRAPGRLSGCGARVRRDAVAAAPSRVARRRGRRRSPRRCTPSAADVVS